MSFHLHGSGECGCPAYLIAMGQMDQILERELESLPAAACVPLAWQEPRPKLLDLFCCAGGAAMGYHRAGFDVTGVDIKPQPRYPFRFIQGDALEYAEAHGHEFDAIHASPPCQAHSSLKVMPNARHHEDLIPQTRAVLVGFRGPWVIENVIGAPLEKGSAPLFSEINGITLCGSMFGLNNGAQELRRHRMFECSILLPQPSCRHALPVVGFYGDHARTRQRTIKGNRNRGGDITGRERKLKLVRELMDIDWMEWRESNQAIPPAYTEFIGRELMRVVLQGDRLGAAAGKSECLMADAGGENQR